MITSDNDMSQFLSSIVLCASKFAQISYLPWLICHSYRRTFVLGKVNYDQVNGITKQSTTQGQINTNIN